jgi:exonuclease SbcC
MEELQAVRQTVVNLLGDLKDVEEAVVSAERLYEGKCYAMAYVDLADNVVGRANELNEFQERILGDDFFGTPGDLRWNKYLYIIAGPKSLSDTGFEKAKTEIESDKEYARKRVVSEEELEALLGAAQYIIPSSSSKDFNVVDEWQKRLAAAELDELLDRPARKDVIERIGTRSTKRVPVADKNLLLDAADFALARKWLTGISIDKFRAVHDKKSYKFGQVTLIVGPNGTGKTSLLEAIEYFYCGNNRRPGPAGTPKILGTVLGSSTPIAAALDSRRIRARCFSWYNRDERLAKAILAPFTRYNFLDTDAAFRLSTELEPSEIPNDLSRLLVGADASMIWDYLTKISPEVETAYLRAVGRANENRSLLEVTQKELEGLKARPSNAKSLTEAFRIALDEIRWQIPKGTTSLVTPEEAKELPGLLGHIQAVLAAGPSADSLNAIAKRIRELDKALGEARPLDNERTQHEEDARGLTEKVTGSERASQQLDRWLTYLNSGFSTVHERLTKAKMAANAMLARLGIYASGEIPEVPENYAGLPLESGLQMVNLDVEVAVTQVADLEKLSSNFGKAASARAQAARQLRAAAEASFNAGHPRDDCPICRTKYASQDLAILVDQITSALEQSSELTEVAARLSEAQKRLLELQDIVRVFRTLQRIAEAVKLAPYAVCADVPARLEEMRAELVIANSELEEASADWAQLGNSGLTANEHELLKSAIEKILSATGEELNAVIISEARAKFLEAVDVDRKKASEKLKLASQLKAQLAEFSKVACMEGWNTRASPDGGIPSLMTMREEVGAIQRRADVLQSLISLNGGASLSELSVGVMGSARLHAEAIEAVKIENGMSRNISTLTLRTKELGDQLTLASSQVESYQAAKNALELLLKECSLERATQESLNAISSQINDIFSRIHAPNEYEYVGEGETFLQTSVTHEKRTLEQVSTGQRAAFALSVFLAMNRSATSAPPVILIDDPIAHIDDLNALSFLDYLRDLAVNSKRQIFFATADTRIASLFTRKFGFLGDSFKTISLAR